MAGRGTAAQWGQYGVPPPFSPKPTLRQLNEKIESERSKGEVQEIRRKWEEKRLTSSAMPTCRTYSPCRPYFTTPLCLASTIPLDRRGKIVSFTTAVRKCPGVGRALVAAMTRCWNPYILKSAISRYSATCASSACVRFRWSFVSIEIISSKLGLAHLDESSKDGLSKPTREPLFVVPDCECKVGH